MPLLLESSWGSLMLALCQLMMMMIQTLEVAPFVRQMGYTAADDMKLKDDEEKCRFCADLKRLPVGRVSDDDDFGEEFRSQPVLQEVVHSSFVSSEAATTFQLQAGS